MKLTLNSPHIQFQKTYLEGLNELQSESDEMAWIYLGDKNLHPLPLKDFPNFVSLLLKRETEAPPHFVCDTVFWAFLEDTMVGRISIRHELNDHLKKMGGHIGYIVRPSFRKKGIATQMLNLALKTERAQKIGKLLLTCDDGNIASEKTILNNGGIYENSFDQGNDKPLKKRFWITL